MNYKRFSAWIRYVSNQNWFSYVLLVFITALAAGFRFYKLGQWSFWIDEIFTLNHALRHYGNIQLILVNIPPHRNWVTISVLLTAQVLNLLGVSEWSARLVSAVIGFLSIPILYFPLKKIFGKQVTLITMLLLALSPWHIFWSQNARFYTSLFLFSSLALFSFYYALEKNRPGFLLVFYILLYFASSERLLAIFVLPVVVCYVLSLWIFKLSKPMGFNRRFFILFLMPIILITLFEFLSFLQAGSSLTTHFLDTFAGQQNTTPFRLGLSISYKLGIPVLILGIVGGLFGLLKKERQGLFVFISATLPVILLIVLSMFMFTVDRYIFITLLFWLIASAWAIQELYNLSEGYSKLLSFGVLLILLVTSFSESFLYYQFQNGNRPDWKEAYRYVEETSQDEDIIIFTTRPEVGDYYLPDADNREINSFDPSIMIEPESKVLYFIIDENTGYVNPLLYSWIKDNCTLIQNIDVYLPGKSMSIRIYRFYTAMNSS